MAQIEQILFLPPMAVARLGGSDTPLETLGRVADALRRWVRISLKAKLNEPK